MELEDMLLEFLPGFVLGDDDDDDDAPRGGADRRVVVAAAAPAPAPLAPDAAVVVAGSVAPDALYVPVPLAMPDTDRGVGGAAGAEAAAAARPGYRLKPVVLARSADVQAARMKLPVCAMEQEIVEVRVRGHR
jgi:hypothetical protein